MEGKVSKVGLDIVKKWEGFRDTAYLCPANVWTIGYGTTRYSNGQAVKKGDKITKEEATKLLEKQVNEHSSTIYQFVKVQLNQNQFDALASFQYNLGKYILKGSVLSSYINAKQWDKAAREMNMYVKAGGKVLQGLVNRRKEESQLFLKPVEVVNVKPKEWEVALNDTSRQAIKDALTRAAVKGLISSNHLRKLNKYDDEQLLNYFLSAQARELEK